MKQTFVQWTLGAGECEGESVYRTYHVFIYEAVT